MMIDELVAVDKLADNFLLFVDPVMKGMYQVDLHQTLNGSGPQPIHGVDIRTSTMPERAAFDLTSQYFYWHDNEFDGQNIIKRMSLAGDVAERALTVLKNGIDSIVCSRAVTRNIILLEGRGEGHIGVTRIFIAGCTLFLHFTFTFDICHRPSVCRLSVCNVRASYFGD